MNFPIKIKMVFLTIRISKEHLKDLILQDTKYQPFSKLLISSAEAKLLKKSGVIFIFHLLPHLRKPMLNQEMEF